jgi:hypothetical protein
LKIREAQFAGDADSHVSSHDQSTVLLDLRASFARNEMVNRMIADGFSIDVYCNYLNISDVPDSECTMSSTMLSRRSTSGSSSQGVNTKRPAYILPRLAWIGLGPSIMMTLSVLRLESRDLTNDGLDWIFAVVVTLVLAVRWGAWLLGDKRDSFGARTGVSGPVCFSALLLFFSAAIWTLATLIATQNAIL